MVSIRWPFGQAGRLRAPEEKASRTAVLLPGVGRARWTPNDYASLAREGYERGEAVEIEPVEAWIAPYRVVRL